MSFPGLLCRNRVDFGSLINRVSCLRHCTSGKPPGVLELNIGPNGSSIQVPHLAFAPAPKPETVVLQRTFMPLLQTRISVSLYKPRRAYYIIYFLITSPIVNISNFLFMLFSINSSSNSSLHPYNECLGMTSCT